MAAIDIYSDAPTEDELKSVGVYDAPPTKDELAQFAPPSLSEVAASKPQDDTSLLDKIETAGRSVAKGMTFGLSEPAISGINALIGHAIEPKQSISDLYNTDVLRRRDLEKKLPGTDLGGEIAGAFMPTSAPSLAFNASEALIKSAGNEAPALAKVLAEKGLLGTGARIAKGVTQGAALTGVDLGAKKIALEPTGFASDEEMPSAKDTLTNSAKISAALSAIPEAGPYLNDAASALKDRAETNAFLASGAMKRDALKAMIKNRVNDIGRTLLDSGAVKVLSTPRGIYNRVVDQIGEQAPKLNDLVDATEAKLNSPKFIKGLTPEQQGSIIQNLYRPKQESEALTNEFISKYGKAADDELNPAFDKFAKFGAKGKFADIDEARDAVEDQLNRIGYWKQMPDMDEDEKAALVDKFAKKLYSMGKPLGFKDAFQTKQQYDRFINSPNFSKEQIPIKQEAYLALRGSLRRGTEKLADAVANIEGVPGGELRETNRILGNLQEARDIALNRTAGLMVNRGMSLTDTLAGGAGVTAGALLGEGHSPRQQALDATLLGTALATANKFARSFGDSMAAKTEDWLSRALQVAPNALGPYKDQLIRAAASGQAAYATALKEIAQKPEIQQKVQSMPNPEAATPVDIPTEYVGAARDLIKKDQTMSVVDKAKHIDQLNKYGSLDPQMAQKLMNKVMPAPAAVPGAAPGADQDHGLDLSALSQAFTKGAY